MKKLTSLLGSCLLLAGLAPGATLTVSNYQQGGGAVHTVADSAAVAISGDIGRGTIGRFTLSDVEVANKTTAGDITGLNAAFVPFDPADSSFALNSLGRAGSFETQLDADTRASTRPGYGGSSIYFWLYKGTSRTTASEYILARSSLVFPTDPESAPSTFPVNVMLNPESVAALLAGTHQASSASGEVGLYKMISTTTQANVAPVANNGTLDARSGRPKTGTLTASDANANTTLSFSVVTGPTKGTIELGSNGSYTYTAGVAELGADSFTFKANDGTEDSNIATISITITAPPPNTAPVVEGGSFTVASGDLLTRALGASDAEDDSLNFVLVGNQPANASFFELGKNADEGFFSYRSQAGFSGVETFSFKVNDGAVDSAVATVTIVVEQTSSAWTWVAGNNLPKQRGIYTGEIQKPGARTEASSVSDGNGISYHFGGSGYGEGTKTGMLNDLWKYNATTGVWTWLKGSKEVAATGIYGTKGTPAADNTPGARSGALLWLDGAGDLWLFGGASSTTAFFNDLWKFNTTTSEWTWIGGANTTNSLGVYGQTGVAAEANTPGARSGSVGLTDPSGNLIVFGGRGLPETGTKVGLLNDLWSYNTSTGQWTWIKGGKTIDAVGVYGAKGVAGGSLTPGGRTAAAGWIGGEGTLLVFGGNGRGTAATLGNLNDLWKYNVLSNEWTWVSGASTVNAVGVYGTQGQAAAGNTPGARAGASAVVGADGGLLLFGGQGSGYFNDVWRFEEEAGLWAWIKGPNVANGVAFYGTLGVASPSATPGARRGSSVFTDSDGDLLVFAGANGANTNNDVWHLDLPNLPVVKLLPIAGITSTGATVKVAINPNGAGTTASLKLIRLTGEQDEETIDLGSIPAGTQEVEVTQILTELEEGSRYAVRVEAENAFGEGNSQILLFNTAGTLPAIVANFESSSSTANEGDGTVNLTVVLNSPAATAFTLPFTFGEGQTASPGTTGDFLEATVPLSFVTGQSQASISIPVIDDLKLDPGETVIVQLGQPSEGSNVTVGAVATHTLTIDDNDSMTLASQLVRLGSKVVFQSPIIGTGITYQWKKNNALISKATLSSYTLASVKLTDAGSFTVTAKNAQSETITSDLASLAVVDTTSRTVFQQASKVLTLTVPASGTGLTFQWYKGEMLIDGETTNTLTREAPLDAAVSGAYTCVVSNGSVSLRSGVIDVHVYDTVIAPATPVFLAGTYIGLVEVEEDVAPLGGRVDLTVTTKGAYTAKLTLGTAALSAKGQLSIVDGDKGLATASFVRKGLPNLTLQFVVEGSAENPLPSVALEGTLADPFTGETTDIEGYRNRWVAKPKVGEVAATAYAGDYTFGLDLPFPLIGNREIPQGDGFGALTVTAAGTATYTGRTADGGKFTVATIVGPEGDLPFYAAFTLTPGYLTGVTKITLETATAPETPDYDSNGLGGSLAWKKVAADVKSKELAYRAGFDEIELNVDGGKWKGPAAGQVIANLPNTTNSVRLVLHEGGPDVLGIDPFVFSITNTKPTGVAQTVVVPKFNAAGNPNPNPNMVTFKLIAKPVGHYSGTFIVPNPVKTLVRTATYQGTFVRQPTGDFVTYGFFLLPQLPEPGQTIKTSAQLSGQALIGGNAQIP